MMKKLFLILLLVLLPCSGWATDYYVDITDGLDANAGTIGAPWQNLSKITSFSASPGFAAGDNIYLKAGKTWRPGATGNIVIVNSGSPGLPITIGKYGTGADPIIDPSIVTTGWTDEGEGIYSKASSRTQALFEDGVALVKSPDAGCSPGNWYQDATAEGTLYYKPTSLTPADHTVERLNGKYGAEKYSIGVELTNRSYITVQDISFKKCEAAVWAGSEWPTVGAPESVSNIIVQRITTDKCFRGVQVRGAVDKIVSSVQILDSTINYSALGINFIMWDCDSGDLLGHAQYFTSMTVRGNSIGYTALASTGVTWIQAYENVDYEALSAQDIQDSTWEQNSITNSNGRGIFLYSNASNSKISGNNIRRNYVSCVYNKDAGFLLMQTDGGVGVENNTFSYNIFDGCGNGDSGAVYVGLTGQPAGLIANSFVNNTVYNGYWMGIYLPTNNAGPWIIKNNIIKGLDDARNIFKATAGGTGWAIDYNLYPAGGANTFYDGEYKTFAQWDDTYDTHSPAPGDPLFTSTSTFYIPTGSPAKDAGVSVGLTSDYLGNYVPYGALPDIGALEFPSYGPKHTIGTGSGTVTLGAGGSITLR